MFAQKVFLSGSRLCAHKRRKPTWREVWAGGIQTFGQRWMWGVGWRSWWAWVTPFSLEREKRETEGCETSPLEFWVLCLSLRTRVGSGLQAQCRLP